MFYRNSLLDIKNFTIKKNIIFKTIKIKSDIKDLLSKIFGRKIGWFGKDILFNGYKISDFSWIEKIITKILNNIPAADE